MPVCCVGGYSTNLPDFVSAHNSLYHGAMPYVQHRRDGSGFLEALSSCEAESLRYTLMHDEVQQCKAAAEGKGAKFSSTPVLNTNCYN
jgi:hypothetical protein